MLSKLTKRLRRWWPRMAKRQPRKPKAAAPKTAAAAPLPFAPVQARKAAAAVPLPRYRCVILDADTYKPIGEIFTSRRERVISYDGKLHEHVSTAADGAWEYGPEDR